MWLASESDREMLGQLLSLEHDSKRSKEKQKESFQNIINSSSSSSSSSSGSGGFSSFGKKKWGEKTAKEKGNNNISSNGDAGGKVFVLAPALKQVFGASGMQQDEDDDEGAPFGSFFF
jgi:hypothetical protein